MPSVGERFGRWDDRSRLDGNASRWLVRSLAVTFAVVLIGGAVGPLLTPTGYVVAFVLTVAVLIAYVVWRRRWNRRLTGSPTTWPAGQ